MSLLDEKSLKSGQRLIEDTIKQISGVDSCHVVIGDSDEIEEVHILAESNRTPKQIVRDVESAIMAKLEIQLDHKKISVAQTKAKGKESYKRLRIEDVEVKGTKTWINARISLKLGEKIYEGISEGPNSVLNRYKILANAVGRAIEDLLEKKVRIVVEDISWQNLAGQEVCTVIITCVSNNSIDTLVGSCIGTLDKDLATVKVVLDALNRRLDSM